MYMSDAVAYSRASSSTGEEAAEQVSGALYPAGSSNVVEGGADSWPSTHTVLADAAAGATDDVQLKLRGRAAGVWNMTRLGELVREVYVGLGYPPPTRPRGRQGVLEAAS